MVQPVGNEAPPTGKGVIYYSDGSAPEPLASVVRQHILAAGLPIVSATLAPLDFGENIVLSGKPSALTLYRQIAAALERSQAEVVYFCEHDVLYPPSHFDFTPERGDLFYYDSNVWRWDYPHDRLITYDGLISLSGLCCYRKLVLAHYHARLRECHGLPEGRDPVWARRWGYEPGCKPTRRGGFSDEGHALWYSARPMIDIRHARTFTPRKVQLESFRRLPTGWREARLADVTEWDLREMFGL